MRLVLSKDEGDGPKIITLKVLSRGDWLFQIGDTSGKYDLSTERYGGYVALVAV